MDRRPAPRPPRLLSERAGKWVLNAYPPFFFGRIRVVGFGPGYRSCRVRVARSLLTRNLNGTTFGGTIFSAADPIHAVMYWQILARQGRRVRVWLRQANIRYLKPATTALALEFSLTEEEIREVLRQLDAEGRAIRAYKTNARDAAGEVCAVIETEVCLLDPSMADPDKRE